MDHLTVGQKKQFLSDEFSIILKNSQSLDRHQVGIYSCNHNN